MDNGSGAVHVATCRLAAMYRVMNQSLENRDTQASSAEDHAAPVQAPAWAQCVCTLGGGPQGGLITQGVLWDARATVCS